MKTVAALSDMASELLFSGTLMTHRRGPEKGRPYLHVSIWCPYCRHHHYIQWVDICRLDGVVGPVTLPCRGDPYGGRPAYVGLDPERSAENRRTYEAFQASLRRFEVQRRLERQLATSRAEDRLYLRDFPDAIHARQPADHLATGWIPLTNTTFNPSPSAQL